MIRRRRRAGPPKAEPSSNGPVRERPVTVRYQSAMEGGGKSTIDLAPGSTVRVAACVDALLARYPNARHRVFLPDGRVRPDINIFVGKYNIKTLGGLQTEVHAGQEVTIMPAQSGG